MARTKEAIRSNGKYMGARTLRKEDPRLLSGKGSYVDDVHLPNTLHVAFVRSDYAHARITKIDVNRARALPGVATVITAADLKGIVDNIPPMGVLPDLYVPQHPV